MYLLRSPTLSTFGRLECPDCHGFSHPFRKIKNFTISAGVFLGIFFGFFLLSLELPQGGNPLDLLLPVSLIFGILGLNCWFVWTNRLYNGLIIEFFLMPKLF